MSTADATTQKSPPQTFTDLQRKFLSNFYEKSGIAADDLPGKVALLQGKLGATSFHAWGGNETREMELNALEFVYLTEAGQL